MIYCFDIDGTICTKVDNSEYERALPFPLMIDKINKLYDDGHEIKLFTARGGATGKDFTELTKKQMKEWGVKHHQLIMGKPSADFYIDDKAIHADYFLGIKLKPLKWPDGEEFDYTP